MNKLRRVSIAVVSIILLVVVATLFLSLVGYVGYNIYSKQKRADLLDFNKYVAKQASISLAVPLWNFDFDQIREVSQSMMLDHAVYSVVVKQTNTDRIVRNLTRDKNWNIVDSKVPVSANRFLSQTYPIQIDNDIIGSVEVNVTPQFLENHLKNIRLGIAIGILSLDILLTLTLFLLIWSFVLKPIRKLDIYAQKVSGEDYNHSNLLMAHFYGELESLGNSISKMVVLLESRYESLKSESKKTEESENLFKTLIQTIPDVVWLKDPNGVFISCNEMFEYFFGVSKADLIGKTDYDIFDKNLADGFRFYDKYVQDTGKKSINEEWVTKAYTGSSALVETIKVPMHNQEGELIGVLGVAREITERVLAKQKLLENEERLKEAQQIASIGNWELTLATSHLFWSDEIYCIFEIDPEHFEATYDAFLNAIHPDDRETVNQAYSSSLETKTAYDIVHRLLMTDGRIKYVHERCKTIFGEDDRPIRSIGTVQDVTELVNMQKKLEQYQNNLEILIAERTNQLASANTELEQSNQNLFQEREKLHVSLRKLEEAQVQLVHAEKMASLGLLSAGIAHEINNPLNFIHGGILGIESYFNDSLQEHVETVNPLINAVHEGVKRASEIVSSLSHYSRRDDLPVINCDIQSIVDNCLVILKGQVKDSIEIIKLYSEPPILVYGNEGKLHQAIINILGNAIQSMEGQNGTIKIETGSDNELVWLSIADDGCGIAKNDLPKIFDPFFTTKPTGKGTGLGLSITYNIIQEHLGRIECESQGGRGTKFTIFLPNDKK